MTARIWHWGDDPSPLLECIRSGGVIALPTESSYALGALPGSAKGIEAIEAIKGRQRGKPQPVVVADTAQIWDLGIEPNSPGLAEARRHWPAALSVVLPLNTPLAAAGNEPGVAVRIPAHSQLRGLLRALGTGVTATSANRSGRPPITEVGPLRELLIHPSVWIVDGGVLPGGAPSTLVRWNVDRFDVLREGRYSLPPFANQRPSSDKATTK